MTGRGGNAVGCGHAAGSPRGAMTMTRKLFVVDDDLLFAKLLAANLIPVVWVPPIPVRELRGLLAHRRRLVQQRTQLRNRLHSLLHRHQLFPQ